MTRNILGVIFAVIVGACSGDTGAGIVSVAISGEDGAVIGYPAGDIMFVDGFTLTFTKVLVSVSDFRLEATDGDSVPTGTDPVIADLHLGDQALWTIGAVPARRWDVVSYRYVPATTSARQLPGVAEADVDAMIASGYSLFIEGSATDGVDTIPFSYGFDLSVDNHSCRNGVDETAGIVVRDNSTTEAQVTVHLDHLFFDSYAIDEPSMRFEPMAAMWDGTSPLDLAALAGQSLSSIVDRDGMPIDDGAGGPVIHDPGPLSLSALNLREYVRAAATTTGHFNGEGHCEYEL